MTARNYRYIVKIEADLPTAQRWNASVSPNWNPDPLRPLKLAGHEQLTTIWTRYVAIPEECLATAHFKIKIYHATVDYFTPPRDPIFLPDVSSLAEFRDAMEDMEAGEVYDFGRCLTGEEHFLVDYYYELVYKLQYTRLRLYPNNVMLITAKNGLAGLGQCGIDEQWGDNSEVVVSFPDVDMPLGNDKVTDMVMQGRIDSELGRTRSTDYEQYMVDELYRFLIKKGFCKFCNGDDPSRGPAKMHIQFVPILLDGDDSYSYNIMVYERRLAEKMERAFQGTLFKEFRVFVTRNFSFERGRLYVKELLEPWYYKE